MKGLPLMNDYLNLRILEETMRQLRGLAHDRAISVSDIVQEALGEYLYSRNTGVNVFDVIRSIENTLHGLSQFVTNADPSGRVLFIKSPLRHVHRPELKYEVRIVRNNKVSVGMLNVILRSHDMETIRRFAAFVNLWIELECRYLARCQEGQVQYRTDAGYFGREIHRPRTTDRNGGPNIGEAIGSYIRVFDELLKYHYNRMYDGQTLEQLYFTRLQDGKIII